MTEKDLIRRTHDAFALAREDADAAREQLRAIRGEVGDENLWERIKASALHRGTFRVSR
jgi:hypothetical protein